MNQFQQKQLQVWSHLQAQVFREDQQLVVICKSIPGDGQLAASLPQPLLQRGGWRSVGSSRRARLIGVPQTQLTYKHKRLVIRASNSPF